MNRLVVRGMAFSVLLNLVVKSAWILGVELGIQRVVGNESYGQYYSLFNITVLFLIVLDLGITNFNIRNIAQHSQLLNKHLGGLTILKFILGIVYLLVLLPVGYILNNNSDSLQILFLLGVAQMFNSFTLYFRSNLNALFRFGWDAVLSVADRLLLILFCSIVLLGIESISMDILLFAKLQMITSFITMLIAAIANFKVAGSVKLNFNPVFYYSILRQSLPFAMLVLIMSVYTKSDAVLLSYLLEDASEAGIYAAGYRLFDAYAQFAVIATGVLYPFFSRSIKFGESVNAIFGWSIRLLISSAFFLTIMSLFFSNELAELLYKENIPETARVLSVLMFVSVPYVLSIVAGSYITAAGRIRFLVQVALLCAFLNIVLNIIFIPSHGAFASAFIAVLTQIVSASVLIYFIAKRLQFVNTTKWIIRLSALVVALLSGAFVISNQSWPILLDVVMMLFLFVIALLFTRILDFKMLYVIFKSNVDSY